MNKGWNEKMMNKSEGRMNKEWSKKCIIKIEDGESEENTKSI